MLPPIDVPGAHDRAMLALMLVPTAAYLAYFYGLSPARLERGVAGEHPQRTAVLRSKLGGGVVLGAGAALAALLAGDGAWHSAAPAFDLRGTALALVAGVAVFVPIVARSARNEAVWSRYPEIRGPWDASTAWRSAAAWTVYLAGYEYMFRGVLLFGLGQRIGMWPAIAVTTALYVAVHLPKMASETVSCLLMGVVFAIAALMSGSVVAPWLLHVVIALTSESVAAASDPRRSSWSDRWLRRSPEQGSDVSLS